MTTVRIVASAGEVSAKSFPPGSGPPPSILVSYAFIRSFMKHRSSMDFRDWALDSGAFTAWRGGSPVDLSKYIDFCLEQRGDERLTEVFALDVIGDPAASYKNAVEMQKAGVAVIPTHHFGSPRKNLERLCAEFPKVALGGMVGKHPKVQLAWCREMFAIAWPKPFHAFGVTGEGVLNALPFHSADSTSWFYAIRYGLHMMYRGARGRFGTGSGLRPMIDRYLDLEKRLRFRWRREMAQLDKMLGV